MSLRDWFENRRNKQLNADLVESKISGDDLLKLWEKCYNCNTSIPQKELGKICMYVLNVIIISG